MSLKKLYNLRESWGHYHFSASNLDHFIREYGQKAEFQHIGADKADRRALYAVFHLKAEKSTTLLALTAGDLENIGQRMIAEDFPFEVMANLRAQLAHAAAGFQACAKLGKPAAAGPLPAHYRLAFSA